MVTLVCRGYLAPEYAIRGQLSEKVDIFSFGIVALELVSGRNHFVPSLPPERAYLLDWVCDRFTISLHSSKLTLAVWMNLSVMTKIGTAGNSCYMVRFIILIPAVLYLQWCPRLENTFTCHNRFTHFLQPLKAQMEFLICTLIEGILLSRTHY